ncbi:hypothetical protein LR48_Vigan347s001700 [Vigna angularis]|uniref:Uncharacterized protein n=1 Tax=Phaseolus angularis TaxID=3914 RepID=A0A0L9T8R7_PHAAN|nr:hypothetical protein LR48_Vigan347s001700 [Vigna angularis]
MQSKAINVELSFLFSWRLDHLLIAGHHPLLLCWTKTVTLAGHNPAGPAAVRVKACWTFDVTCCTLLPSWTCNQAAGFSLDACCCCWTRACHPLDRFSCGFFVHLHALMSVCCQKESEEVSPWRLFTSKIYGSMTCSPFQLAGRPAHPVCTSPKLLLLDQGRDTSSKLLLDVCCLLQSCWTACSFATTCCCSARTPSLSVSLSSHIRALILFFVSTVRSVFLTVSSHHPDLFGDVHIHWRSVGGAVVWVFVLRWCVGGALIIRGWRKLLLEEAYEDDVQEEAYEGDVQEEAFEALDHDDDEEEHADVGDIEEDIGGFPEGPRDASLLTYYVKHVAYGISKGRSWIYEHFPSMGRRRLVSSYDDSTPRAAWWQSPRQSSTLAEIRSQLDGLIYSGVVWHSYEGHRGIRPLFNICMYSCR